MIGDGKTGARLSNDTARSIWLGAGGAGLCVDSRGVPAVAGEVMGIYYDYLDKHDAFVKRELRCHPHLNLLAYELL